MTRADYRHAASRLSGPEWRAWQEGSIEVTDRDGNWELTDLGMRRLALLTGAVMIGGLLFLAVVL